VFEVGKLVSKHLRYNLLIVFAKGPHCLWCPKSQWNPLLGTYVTLKIGKNILEDKIMAPQNRGGG